MELYTHLPNRLGLHLIEYDKFNHVDFLYSHNVSDMVYESVLNTIYPAELLDWIPVYDKTTSFNNLNDDMQCNDLEIKERSSKKKNSSFWNKITKYIIQKEVYPITQIKEDDEIIKSRNTFLKSWKETIYL